MGNIVSIQNMTEAIKEATEKFQYKWGKENKNNIRIFLQQPSHLPLLQVADYILWAVYQVYEHDEFRYFDFMKDKIKLVHDIFDVKNNQFYGTFYSEKNPLVKKDESHQRLGFQRNARHESRLSPTKDSIYIIPFFKKNTRKK